jgi:hypothetical protein
MAATSDEAKKRTEVRMIHLTFESVAAGANDGRIAFIPSTRG